MNKIKITLSALTSITLLLSAMHSAYAKDEKPTKGFNETIPTQIMTPNKS